MTRPQHASPTMLIAACLAMALGSALAWWLHRHADAQKGTASVQGLLWPPPRTLSNLDLVDQHGVPFGADRLNGRWSLVFFGFTNCPDVCPTTLQTLKQALPTLPADTQVVFVSVDPERDSAAKLAGYLAYFNPAFIGLSGPPEKIEGLEKSLGVLAARVPLGSDGSYTMDHTAAVFLLDPKQREVGVISPPLSVESVRQAYTGIRRFIEKQG